jgi:hypothetical protein
MPGVRAARSIAITISEMETRWQVLTVEAGAVALIGWFILAI